MDAASLSLTFDFYVLKDGLNGAKQIELLQRQRMEVPPETAVEAINQRFEFLVSQQQDNLPILVIAARIGDPPGMIVATECVDANTVDRRLAWVTDLSTGLKRK